MKDYERQVRDRILSDKIEDFLNERFKEDPDIVDILKDTIISCINRPELKDKFCILYRELSDLYYGIGEKEILKWMNKRVRETLRRDGLESFGEILSNYRKVCSTSGSQAEAFVICTSEYFSRMYENEKVS